jgi:hypothetical protein
MHRFFNEYDNRGNCQKELSVLEKIVINITKDIELIVSLSLFVYNSVFN